MSQSFYHIKDNEDGTADVYFYPAPKMGIELILRGVEKTDDMEEDIRRRYGDWCASADEIIIEKAEKFLVKEEVKSHDKGEISGQGQ